MWNHIHIPALRTLQKREQSPVSSSRDVRTRYFRFTFCAVVLRSTTFLHQNTPVYTGIEMLSRRYNTAVVYCEIRRVKRGYYEVDITLITENAAETGEMEITEKHVKLLEQTIRRNPQYWLWSHRR